MVNNLPAMQEISRPLCQEDPLEKVMATHSSILAWEIPWTEEPDRLYIYIYIYIYGEKHETGQISNIHN